VREGGGGTRPSLMGDRYLLRERLGAGGMGEVIAARDEVIGRDIAIKRMLDDAPTGEQVKLLSALTGFPILFFYEPIAPGPILGRPGQIIICYRRKVNGKRCHAVDQHEVDANGVLHYSGEPRRTLPKWWTDGQGALF